jgi:CSLREA domain-containing protein
MKSRLRVLAPAFVLSLVGVVVPHIEPAAAAGATITVTTVADDTNPADNQCSLREAMQAADTNAAFNTCAAGSTGTDTIAFDPSINGTPITLTSPLEVDSNVIIKGNGRSKTTITGDELLTEFSATAAIEHMTLQDVNNEDATVSIVDVKATSELNNNSSSGETSIMHVTNSSFPGVTNNSGIDNTALSKLTISKSKVTSTIDNNSDSGSVTTASITNTTVSLPVSQPATGDGVGINGTGTSVTITRSTVVGFDIGVDTGGKTKIVNSTIIGNISDNVEMNGGNTTILNSTLTKSDTGIDRSAGTIKLTNSIVGLTSVKNCNGTVTSGGGNISDDGSCHFNKPHDRNNKNPKLSTLGAHGGPTQTQVPLAGSPAIDTGLNGPCPATDQRGKKRPQDGNHDGTKICDVGSVEVVA